MERESCGGDYMRSGRSECDDEVSGQNQSEEYERRSESNKRLVQRDSTMERERERELRSCSDSIYKHSSWHLHKKVGQGVRWRFVEGDCKQ
jgi:hypothetical protein